VQTLLPLLAVSAAAFGVMLAIYCGICWFTRTPGGGGGGRSGSGVVGAASGGGVAGMLLGRRRLRRPHGLVAGSGGSPRGSPSGSPRSGGSPRRGSSRAAQQRLGVQSLLSTNSNSGAKKSARLHN
jgi:hypothetical protein